VQPARRARVRLAVFVTLAALTVASTGMTLAADRSRVHAAGRSAWDRRTDDAVRLVVTFKGRASRSDARAFERSAMSLVTFEGATRRAVFETTRTALRSEKRRLEHDPSIDTVQVSHRLQRALDPENEQYWDALWGLHNTGQTIEGSAGVANVDVDGRESLGASTGTGVVVAVIDDGIDFSQPDLAGQAWVNPGESGGGKETNNVDDDANGHIDDVNGWDFCHDDKTVHDLNDDFHGTHVSGTIAAKLDGAGIVGLAPGVKLMALKFLGDDPNCGWDDQAIAAIEYAKSFGVRISNNSWARPASAPPFGSPADDLPLYEAIEGSGMLFVAAAGNSNIGQDLDSVSRPSIPASFDLPNVLTVAAVDNTGQLASFSNYGETSVDVSAPGVDVASTTPEYHGEFDLDAGHYYLSGTSMAAPHVSAIAALVGSQAPTLLDSPTDLKKRILDTAKDVGDTNGLTLTGRVADAAAAIDHTDPVSPAPDSYAFVTGKAIGSTISTRVRWPAGSDDLSGVGSYALRQSVNGAAWTTVTASTAGLSVDRSLTFSTAYRYRVRAQDRAGNTGDYVDGPQVRPKLTQQNGTGVTYSGTWTSRSSSSASGGSTRYATKAGAWVQFSFTGRAVAVIAPKGASRGSFKAYVDGTYVGTVSAYRSSSQSRMVLFARNWSASGSHKVKLILTGTSGHPRFDIDAFGYMQ
jgi:subtilisin family serine protease